MSLQHLLVDANGIVAGSCLWDGSSAWMPPAGLRAVRYDGVWRDGWRWDGTKAYDPNPLPVVNTPPAPSPSAGIKTI